MKVFVQIIDTITGIYQTGMIDENVVKGKEIENALLHFGVHEREMTWLNTCNVNNVCTKFGQIEGTSKIVNTIIITHL